jgi:hypothetical protein
LINEVAEDGVGCELKGAFDIREAEKHSSKLEEAIQDREGSLMSIVGI